MFHSEWSFNCILVYFWCAESKFWAEPNYFEKFYSNHRSMRVAGILLNLIKIKTSKLCTQFWSEHEFSFTQNLQRYWLFSLSLSRWCNKFTVECRIRTHAMNIEFMKISVNTFSIYCWCLSGISRYWVFLPPLLFYVVQLFPIEGRFLRRKQERNYLT